MSSTGVTMTTPSTPVGRWSDYPPALKEFVVSLEEWDVEKVKEKATELNCTLTSKGREAGYQKVLYLHEQRKAKAKAAKKKAKSDDKAKVKAAKKAAKKAARKAAKKTAKKAAKEAAKKAAKKAVKKAAKKAKADFLAKASTSVAEGSQVVLPVTTSTTAAAATPIEEDAKVSRWHIQLRPIPYNDGSAAIDTVRRPRVHLGGDNWYFIPKMDEGGPGLFWQP